jgi:apolipoprotein N-acyltransferase
VIDSTGQLSQQTDLFIRTWIKARITPARGATTFYTRWGDLFAYGCILVTAVSLVWGMVGLRPTGESVDRRNSHV